MDISDVETQPCVDVFVDRLNQINTSEGLENLFTEALLPALNHPNTDVYDLELNPNIVAVIKHPQVTDTILFQIVVSTLMCANEVSTIGRGQIFSEIVGSPAVSVNTLMEIVNGFSSPYILAKIFNNQMFRANHAVVEKLVTNKRNMVSSWAKGNILNFHPTYSEWPVEWVENHFGVKFDNVVRFDKK